MFDPTTIEGGLVLAALSLAEQKSWSAVTLHEIAREAGRDLASVRKVVSSKADVLTLFTRGIDDELARRFSVPKSGEEGARDRLFDVIMTRLEMLEPHRAALKSIADDMRTSPGAIKPRSFLASQYWMLASAGINGEGARGAARVAGVAALYAEVLRTWLNDDDPGHAKTMALLDKRLRRGEAVLGQIDRSVTTAKRIACSLIPGLKRRPSERETSPEAAPSAGTTSF